MTRSTHQELKDEATVSTESTVRQSSRPQQLHLRRENQRRRLTSTSESAGNSADLYQVMWDASPRTQGHSAQALPAYQLSPVPTASKPLSSAPLSSSSLSEPLSPPPQQLSVSDLSIIPEQMWSYTLFLTFSLALWLLYLVTPRGFRKQYCNASRKRYPRNMDTDMPASGYWLPANQTQNQGGVMVPGAGSRQAPPMVSRTPAATSNPPLLQASSSASSTGALPEIKTPSTPSAAQRRAASKSPNHPPSPDHPALKRIPSDKILSETMSRLQGRGIRLVAHGVHCDPKRVWIQLDSETKDVTWQTEFPRRVPNQSGQVSIVLMRGSLHRIPLTNVLYIDVGKKTNAFHRTDTSSQVPEATCFSLLTQNGSLDLQANSKLERDSLVSCFSLLLDDVHADLDWRALYEASPDPSLVNSAAGSYRTPAPMGANLSLTPQRSKTKYPNPSDLMVEV